MFIVAIVGRDTETGELQVARLNEKGLERYNDPGYSENSELWETWEFCEDFEAMKDKIWDALKFREIGK